MLCERRSAKCSRPAPTVTFVSLSMMMKPPVSRFSAYGSNGIGRSRLTLHTPISLSSSVVAARWSSVVDVDPVLRVADRDADRAGPDLHQVGASGQHRVLVHPHDVAPRTGRPPRRASSAAQITSPRLASISSARVSVTDWPAIASSRSPSIVTMRSTVLVVPDGRTRIGSPRRIVPPTIRPEKPRKSRFGPVHPLHGHAERAVGDLVVDRHGLEIAEQRRAVVPGRVRRSAR